MTIVRSRILTAVPQTWQTHREIAKALCNLAQRDESERLQRCSEIATIRCELADISQCLQAALHDWAAEVQAGLRKYNADEPRSPKGNSGGGQWTRLDGSAGPSRSAGGAQLAGDPYYPPLPPGKDPKTMTQGQWPNGCYYLEDAESNKYTVHAEDDRHWRHWDIQDGDGNRMGRWPPNAKKPWPGQKRLKGDQSETDPSGDVPPWTPSPLVPVVPLDPMPFPDFPVISPVFIPG